VGEWESGRVGEWESGRVGEWESGRVGEWESGRVGELRALVLPLSPALPFPHFLLLTSHFPYWACDSVPSAEIPIGSCVSRGRTAVA